MPQRPPSASAHRQRLAFLLLPDFTMLALASAIEVLRVANRVLERDAYRWELVSAEGDDVIASNGIILAANAALDVLAPPAMLVVCGGINVRRHVTRAMQAALRRLAGQGVAMAGLCSGGYALARAGLLDGHAAVVQRSDSPQPTDEFPAVMSSQAPFVIDRDRYTAGSGAASLDLMLELLARQHGRGVQLAVREQLGRQARPAAAGATNAAATAAPGGQQQHLVMAVELMEAHIDEPLLVDALAQRVGVSRRQIERLFKEHLGTVPSRYYMGVRLRRAQALLSSTELPIMAVASACGFETAAHFSRCYRAHFGHTPSETRGWVAAPRGAARG